MAEALVPLRAKLPQSVREQEILRIAATIAGDEPAQTMAAARREVLTWAERRCGGRLPVEAWNEQSFEYFAGGRTSLGVRIEATDIDLWAIRGDDPDKNVPGRVWTTEVTIGHTAKNDAPRLSVRLLVSTAEDIVQIEPHTPGFVQQIVDTSGLYAGKHTVKLSPRQISSREDAEDLIDLLEDPARRLPVFVASGDERTEHPGDPSIDTGLLARATMGLAHVVVLPAAYTYALSDYFGKSRSVFFGAVRAFMPGFDQDSVPYDHRLILGETLQTADAKARCVRSLRVLAASESLKRTRLGHDVLPFASVRSASIKLRQERQATEGASETEQLESALERTRALEEELTQSKEWESQIIQFHQEAEERAAAAEAQASASSRRIQQLLSQLSQRDVGTDTQIELPESWSDFADWCDTELAGRLVLTPAARRSVRKPNFENVRQAARCLVWLASECRERRLAGGGSIAEEPVEDGVRNAACGGDAYDFDWRGERLTADWHIKSGGNTRDPKRCLRVYYTWDATSQQIIVADMPAHRRTDAS